LSIEPYRVEKTAYVLEKPGLGTILTSRPFGKISVYNVSFTRG